MGEILEQTFLGAVEDGRWIEFCDARGVGYAQPDFFLVQDHSVVCFEVKLKQTPVAYSQITHLYRPLLRHIFKLPILGVAVFHYLTPERRPVHIHHPLDVVGLKGEQTYVWHVI